LETTVYRDLYRVFGRGYDPDIAERILGEFGKALREGEWPSLRHFSIESRKVRKYLDAMQTIFLARKIPAHPQSVGGDVWMLLDSGLVRHVMKTDQGEGASLSLIRHSVINEISANFEYINKRPRLNFYRSAKGSPVDLICEDQEVMFKIIVQGRGASKGLGWHERPLAGAMKTVGVSRGFLVSPISEIEIPKKKGTIGLLPWSYWS
jgi:predicted AAA+ superfamily ATPase